MAYYRQRGSVPPKRHTQHRAPDGRLYYEELMGEEGFSADSSLLYHREIPSAIVDARRWQLPDLATTPNQPLLARHLRLHDLFDGTAADVDVVTGRRLVFGNADVRISYAVARRPSPLFDARQGDYVMLPRSTTHRWLPAGDEPLRTYCIEANSHITPARKYLSRYGQLLEHSPYCERDLRGPGEPEVVDEDNVEVYLKHRGSGPGSIAGTVYVYPKHPFDVVGWDGCLYPYVFNVADFMPITGKVHQPPPAHQVFEGQNFVICNFVPRKVDYHPLSIPVPYYHSNVDSDEVMFYCGGDYEARKGSGIGQGSISLHPGGHSHGPQPGAYERSIGVQFFDELAVMVDTFRPLELGEGGRAADDGAYAWSWTGGRAP